MPNTLGNRVKMSVSGTPGTGTITLGSAITGYQTFAAAGIPNAATVPYLIEDESSWEIGIGTYTSTGTTLARTSITASSNSGAAISATSASLVMITPLAADLQAGTAANNLVQLDGSSKIPALDGSLITSINASNISSGTLNNTRLSGVCLTANNLSDVTAATARTNLGLAIGTNVQAWDADLDAIAAISGTSGLLKKTAANTWSLDTTAYLSGSVSLTTGVTGTLPVGNGGTGGTTGVINRTVSASATSGTLTINTDTTGLYLATGLTGAITLNTPSGSPSDGQKLMIRLKDNGAPRGITWTTTSGAFRAIAITLPTTTTLSKTTYIGCVYNSGDGYWDVIAAITQG